MVFSWVQYQPLTYDDYEYPPWGIVLGWGLAFISLLCLPLGMIHAIVTSNVKPLFKVSSLSSNNSILYPIVHHQCVGKR